METPARRSSWPTAVQGTPQLGTDLAQRLTLGVQVGGTLNIHGANRNESRPDQQIYRGL
jgi:hypothetical protein